jgi:hypothetical protein
MSRIHSHLSAEPAQAIPCPSVERGVPVARIASVAPIVSPMRHVNTAQEIARCTLLTGMPYEVAASHSDSRAFFERMVRRYGLKLKPRA